MTEIHHKNNYASNAKILEDLTLGKQMHLRVFFF
jgi:hypothetical protein